MKNHLNINKEVLSNSFFRKEMITGKNSQVVLMSIPSMGDIGEEVHDVDQTLIFISGAGEAVLDGQSFGIEAGHLVFVPAGTRHNFINTGNEDLKLFTIYSPPEHKPGTIHKTKAEAEAAEAS